MLSGMVPEDDLWVLTMGCRDLDGGYTGTGNSFSGLHTQGLYASLYACCTLLKT